MSRRAQKRAETEALNAARNSIASHVVGFLRAYQEAFVLHQEIGQKEIKLSKISIQVILAQLQIFCVRALETFFRDCFVMVARRDKKFLLAALEKLRINASVDDVGIIEELAGKFNFQNFDGFSDAFKSILNADLFSCVEESNFHLHVVGASYAAKAFNLKAEIPYWRDDLTALCSVRNELIHNANYRFKFDQSAVVRQVSSAFIAGQVIGIFLGQRTSAGIISAEMPLKYVVLLGVAINGGSEKDIKDAHERVQKQSDLDGKVGYAGPALVPAGILGLLDFDDSEISREATSTELHHVVTKTDQGRFSLKTLVPVRGEN